MNGGNGGKNAQLAFGPISGPGFKNVRPDDYYKPDSDDLNGLADRSFNDNNYGLVLQEKKTPFSLPTTMAVKMYDFGKEASTDISWGVRSIIYGVPFPVKVTPIFSPGQADAAPYAPND